MKFNIEDLKKKSKEDYEKAWRETEDLVKKSGESFTLEDKGSSHPLFDLVQEFRKILIETGFREVVVPTLIERDEIKKQYGPKTPIILDRIFFLAGLDRSDLGISESDLEKIREEISEFDSVEELEEIFRRYKEGKISSDDLDEVIMSELDLEEDEAMHILSLFESLKELEPVPSNKTLRSHTTAGWFQVLQKKQSQEPLPVQLFTVGPKYRREQELDETHLYRSWTASLVIMAEEISLEDGKKIAEKILKKMGFEEVEFKKKAATSKYYAPNSELEIYVEHPKTEEMVEIGDAGLYSPISLANYDIPYPVFNLGVGLERVLMIRTGEEDIRPLVYPYKYRELDLSDEQISKMLDFEKKPITKPGQNLVKEIVKTAKRCKDEPSPCEFKITEIEIDGKKVALKLTEPEENAELIGPAAFNRIYISDGNIVGVPPSGWEEDEFLKKAREGVDTGIDYITSFANLAAREIEEAIERGEKKAKVRIPIVESLNDINLELKKPARRYITSNNKKIDVRGPVFTTLVTTIE